MASIDEEITKVEDSTAARDAGICSAAVVNVMQKMVAEVIGTFFVVFAGCGSVVVNKMYGSVTFPGICITWGLIVMVMVYSVGHISGAHFNPAVTITFTIFKRFLVEQLPLYIIAQMFGAILGSGTLYLLFNPKAEHFYGTTPVGSTMQSFILEIIISFLLMFVISGVATDTRAIGELAGMAVGSTILLNVFLAGQVSGASMNKEPGSCHCHAQLQRNLGIHFGANYRHFGRRFYLQPHQIHGQTTPGVNQEHLLS